VAVLVLDASVLIAHLDPGDALHDRATAALLEHESDRLSLPSSAYAETLIVPARAGVLDEARQRIAALPISVVPITREIAEVAAQLRARHRALHLPDALVLACGEVLDADAVLTADARWRRLPRVRVV
jgi:predicted nucleic acid-binding protein